MEEFENVSESLKLTWVHNFVLLNSVNQDHIRFVLNPEYVSEIFKSDNITNKKKILNINAYAKYFLKDSYSGPLIADDEIPDIFESLDESSRDSYERYVFSLLSNFATPPNYSNLDVKTKLGFLIPFETVINEDLKPLDTSKYLSLSTDVKDVSFPNGYKRIVVLPLTYSNVRITDYEPTGLSLFYLRLLKKMDIPVITMNCKEFSQRYDKIEQIKLTVEKVKNLH